MQFSKNVRSFITKVLAQSQQSSSGPAALTGSLAQFLVELL